MDDSKSVTFEDPLARFERGLKELAAELRADIKELEPYAGSESLRFAIAAGLPPQMAYTVSQTAQYSGVCKSTLYREHDAGRLAFKGPGKKYALIRVTEMDRWMEADDDSQDD